MKTELFLSKFSLSLEYTISKALSIYAVSYILKIQDNLVSLVTNNMAKFIIWIVEDSGELTKACLKYAVKKVFQNDGHQSYWAETLHQG